MSNVNTNKSTPSNDKPSASAQAKPSAPTANGSAATADSPTSSTDAKLSPAPVTAANTESDDEKEKILYHIIIGKVDTFPDVSQAEAFLNLPGSPKSTVIHGRISLVNEWHITTGVIHTFPSLVKAQKFLKEPTAPKDFVMVRGRITVPELRVSLRR